MNAKKFCFLISLIAISLFLCLTVSVFVLSKRLRKDQESYNSTVSETIFVNDTNVDYNDSTFIEEKWLVKEYNGVIGIFTSDKKLVQVIDTYIKTLPSKDQALLREGFEVFSQKELNSVIEAYSD